MSREWAVRGRRLPIGQRPLVMGIVNVTPDSFSDGGRFLEPMAAVRHGERLAAEGADILDVGGESTRPGSDPVPPEIEKRRVLPVVKELAGRVAVPISVDTRRALVAKATLEAGAHIVNDVSALSDPGMAEVVGSAEAGLVLMHMKGDPKTMQESPHYTDVILEVREFLGSRAQAAQAAGIRRDAIVVDPGIGFGKRTGAGAHADDNLILLDRLGELRSLAYPLLVGASRKRFIANIVGDGPAARLEGSLAAAAVAVYNGADIVRVHDVGPTRRVVDLAGAIARASAENH